MVWQEHQRTARSNTHRTIQSKPVLKVEFQNQREEKSAGIPRIKDRLIQQAIHSRTEQTTTSRTSVKAATVPSGTETPIGIIEQAAQVH